MYKREEWEPTIWECWQEEHSWSNLKDCLDLLVPMPIYRLCQNIRHPVGMVRRIQKERWIKSLNVGDEVCSCFGHVRIARFDTQYKRRDDFVDQNGGRHSLWHCCAPIKSDNSCHVRTGFPEVQV